MQQFQLTNGQYFILAEAAGGVYNSDQLRVIFELSEESFLKITEDQRLGLAVDESRLGEIQERFSKVGLLLRHYQKEGFISPRTCLGELCLEKEQDALGDAIVIFDEFIKSDLKTSLTMGVNGCAKACVGSATCDIHVVGESSGYKVYLGGKASELPQTAALLLENISKDFLPLVLKEIVQVYGSSKEDSESLLDVYERIGQGPFLEACQAFSSSALVEETSTEDVLSDDGVASFGDDALNDDVISQERDLVAESEADLSEDVAEDLKIPVDDFEMESLEAAEVDESLVEEDVLMEETQDLDLNEATPDDLEKMKSHLEIESKQEDSVVVQPLPQSQVLNDLVEEDVREPAVDDVTHLVSEVLDNVQQGMANEGAPQSRDPLPESQAMLPVKKSQKGGFSVKLVGTDIQIQLPTGVQCAVPLDFVQDDCPFEMDVGGKTLILEKEGNLVKLVMGSLQMSFPIEHSSAA